MLEKPGPWGAIDGGEAFRAHLREVSRTRIASKGLVEEGSVGSQGSAALKVGVGNSVLNYESRETPAAHPLPRYPPHRDRARIPSSQAWAKEERTT